MKKYFVKYLPVEGDIKEGEICFVDDGNGDTDYLPFKQIYMEEGEPYPVKVKPFLCSRDIQVGDEYYNSMGYKVDHTWDEEAIQDSKDFPDDIFKVIGEISPDAGIIEGQEFTEEEVKFLKII